MKLTKILQEFNNRFLSILLHHDVYCNAFISFCLFLFIAIIAWTIGPIITWDNYAPLITVEKRFYLTLFLFLIFLLKFLLIDLSKSDPLQYKDFYIQKKLLILARHYQHSLRFLRKKTLTLQKKRISLAHLPRYLLVGSENTGKTSLLANSNTEFILQHFSADKTTKQCQWWVNKHAAILDIPGYYLENQKPIESTAKNVSIWNFFLHLIKKEHKKNNVAGLIITISLPEIIKHNHSTFYQEKLRLLHQRLDELRLYFSHVIPCYLVITKCDLLPGFIEFFSESSTDELNQAWGFSLPTIFDNHLYQMFSEQFNMLIKTLNQQLISRLHQEPNALLRPSIKDFPLEMEKMKENLFSFIQQYLPLSSSLSLQGVYFTSALQKERRESDVLIKESQPIQRHLHIFQEPVITSRSYFIKQLLTVGLNTTRQVNQPKKKWKQFATFTTSFLAILLVSILLIKDFQRSIKQMYFIENSFSQYRKTALSIQNTSSRLQESLTLLNILQAAKQQDEKIDLSHILSFYSYQSHQKINAIYQKTLEKIFIPEIKNYLENYLNNPINKNIDSIYAVLKAYLMLGDQSHFQENYIINVAKDVLSSNLNERQKTHLMQHLHVALTQKTWSPLILNQTRIQQTREFLSALTGFQLGYLILNNMNFTEVAEASYLSIINPTATIFIFSPQDTYIPNQFTGTLFNQVFFQDIKIAAEQAIVGNWVLGDDFKATNSPEIMAGLIEQLQTAYVNHYVEKWESILTHIHLAPTNSLAKTDDLIMSLIGNPSPLLAFLRTIHDNTYFQPIIASSQKLQQLNALTNQEQPLPPLLSEIFTSLLELHNNLQLILSAENESKAAFEMVKERMAKHDQIDTLMKLRLVAEKSPEPIKSWLIDLANTTWHFMMEEASLYIDLSWQHDISQPNLLNLNLSSTSIHSS